MVRATPVVSLFDRSLMKDLGGLRSTPEGGNRRGVQQAGGLFRPKEGKRAGTPTAPVFVGGQYPLICVSATCKTDVAPVTNRIVDPTSPSAAVAPSVGSEGQSKRAVYQFVLAPCERTSHQCESCAGQSPQPGFVRKLVESGRRPTGLGQCPSLGKPSRTPVGQKPGTSASLAYLPRVGWFASRCFYADPTGN